MSSSLWYLSSFLSAGEDSVKCNTFLLIKILVVFLAIMFPTICSQLLITLVSSYLYPWLYDLNTFDSRSLIDFSSFNYDSVIVLNGLPISSQKDFNRLESVSVINICPKLPFLIICVSTFARSSSIFSNISSKRRMGVHSFLSFKYSNSANFNAIKPDLICPCEPYFFKLKSSISISISSL